jgi:glycosyltransferase involved in cell wall biosynthesis
MTDPRQGKTRVLLVPDSMYWITSTIAREICRHNPWIEPTICSMPVLRKLLKSHSGVYPGEIDVAHFLTPHIATEFMGAFRSTVPCVATIHHIEDDRSLAPARDADAIMTVCHQWHNELVARGVDAEKCVMVPNGVDVSVFSPTSSDQRIAIRKRLGIPVGAFCVGFSGKRSSNTLNRKGTEIFAAAMRLLVDVKDICFVIVGPGWHEFVREQQRAGINCVHFPFLIDRHEVADFYKAIDCYWVTSKIEGGPVPLLEAMSSEVACVSTPVGVALEAIADNENGFIAPFDCAEAYANLTRRLLVDSNMRSRIGRAARETIVDRFQWSKSTLAVSDLYSVADRRFRLRNEAAVGREEIRTGRAANVDSSTSSEMLSSLPFEMRTRVAAEEHLAFMEHLVESGVKYTAIRIGVRAIEVSPTNMSVWLRVLTVIPKLYATRLKSWISKNIPFLRLVYGKIRSTPK